MANLEDSISSCTVSSEFSGSYLKAKAYDNNTSTEWATSGETTGAWIQFDWASPVTIYEIQVRGRSGWSWGRPRFTFSDGIYFEGNKGVGGAANAVFPLFTPKSTTSLRISVAVGNAVNHTSSTNNGLAEVAILDGYSSGTPPGTILSYPDWITASGTAGPPTYEIFNVVDGNSATEWASLNNAASSWIQLNWNTLVTIGSIELTDRNDTNNTGWGVPRFTFSDGSYQDGSSAVPVFPTSQLYTINPVQTTSLKISIVSGGKGNARGFSTVALVTGVLRAIGHVRTPFWGKF